ncbi:hypothetical protein HUU62_01720 [Rhodoferax sp. 4810]|uniref:LPS-assembly lipoprotein LptE n=1 Tax=Thiospirillum jenense TaxID=1653858 RepID=A0A839HBM8_9GAMM|nr:LPS assembly lipoprotein LptE [Thiospirillum jenense]MBB1073131.1 hypothetical protein [Rhodoferax jenense]MBB1124708.1 hypothetical protein [Thiospirillum jenense]
MSYLKNSAAWRVLFLIASGLVMSCGFHLRGSFELPADLTPVYVQPGTAISAALMERLRNSQIALTDQPATAAFSVRIVNEERQSRIVAVDRDGKALAYELSYRVQCEAQRRDGQVLLPLQTITVVRMFDDNPDVAVLGKQLESDLIYRDLIADVADSLLLRLRAALMVKTTTPSQSH